MSYDMRAYCFVSSPYTNLSTCGVEPTRIEAYWWSIELSGSQLTTAQRDVFILVA